MADVSTLVPLETTAIAQAMLFLSATGTDEDIGPTNLVESGLAFLLGAIDLHELGQGYPWLYLDAVGGHDRKWHLGTTMATAKASGEVST